MKQFSTVLAAGPWNYFLNVCRKRGLGSYFIFINSRCYMSIKVTLSWVTTSIWQVFIMPAKMVIWMWWNSSWARLEFTSIQPAVFQGAVNFLLHLSTWLCPTRIKVRTLCPSWCLMELWQWRKLCALLPHESKLYIAVTEFANLSLSIVICYSGMKG